MTVTRILIRDIQFVNKDSCISGQILRKLRLPQDDCSEKHVFFNAKKNS